MSIRVIHSVAGALLLTAGGVQAADLYVSPNGNDKNPGTQEKPIATFGQAIENVRPHAGKTPITVHFADGIYYLPETAVFTPADSGTEKAPVVYRAEHEGGAVLSGGAKLSLQWKPYKDGIFRAKTPAGLAIDQVFINGVNQRMARYPNYDPEKKTDPYQGYSADAFSKERAERWADPAGGYIHAMHRSGWGGYHYLITGKDASGEVTFEGGWQNNRKSTMHNDHRMVENIFEELDAPGEWFHDAKSSTLYHFPMPGTDLNSAVVEVVRLRHLIEFQGSEKKPVRHIALQGFTVRHAARTFMDTKEQMVRSDWAIYRGGALMLTGTEDVRILDCEFDQVGGNAVFVNNYNRRTLVKGCHIHDTGASGVCFVGDPDALYDPLFEYGQKNDLSAINRTPGPKTPNYPALGIVEDCLIHGIGRVERQPAGVQIEMAEQITVRDCSVYDCARAGINIGDGAFGGHLIERVDVFDTVLETHDHGSFNSWGRDRYWRSDHLTASQKAVDAEPGLPFLDAWKTTVIRDSRWRCDHGWDIDLDDGSSNYDICNNLMLNKGLKLREGFRRHAWNNITVNGGLHSHVWFQGSRDEVYGNIFMQPHSLARMDEPYTRDGTLVDRNLYFVDDEKKVMGRSEKTGWDANSVFADPQFVDPAGGDFRVKDGSPALKLGFKNFPMDQFGVKKPSLKAIAKTPEIPELKIGQSPVKGKPAATTVAAPFKKIWLGVELNDLEGEAFSAFGVSKEVGGVALVSSPKGTALKAGDLIQGVNGQAVKNTTQFFQALEKAGTSPLKLKVIRNQAEVEVSVQPASTIEVKSAESAADFSLPASNGWKLSSKPKTNNEPIETLTDGKLAENFGAIFGNTVQNGMYKMDLGAPTPVASVTSWTYNQNKSRGAQLLTVYGSADVVDPGWDLDDYTPLGTIETGATTGTFTAASLKAIEGEKLGTFRWIVWVTYPVHERGGGENSAFQELSVK